MVWMQLAKRKADELEDFNAENDTSAGLDETVIEEGNALVEQFLRTWAVRVAQQDDGDVVMGDDDGDENSAPEAQLEELEKCFEEFRHRLDGNPWAQRIVASLA